MNIAIIGLGVMGQNHFKELSQKDVKIYACDVIKPSFDCNFYNNLDKLLNIDLDGAIIATPTKFHYEIFTKIHKKVRNILIEKPLSVSLNEAEQIKSLAKYNNVCIGFCERFNPVSLAFKETSKNEKIKYANFTRVSKYPTRISDVGVDLDLSVHDIDMANFFGLQADFNINRKFKNNLCTEIKLNSNNIDILASWEFNSRIRKAIINTDKSSYELDFLNSTIIKDENLLNIKKHSSLSKEHDEFINLINTNIFGNLATIDDSIYAQSVLI